MIEKVGCKKTSPHFVLLYYNGSSACPRLGITVSKKNGNAVERNAQKRIIREYFRNNKLKINNYDFLVIVRRKFYDKKSLTIFSELDEIFNIT